LDIQQELKSRMGNN